MIRLVATDLDGTLWGPDMVVPEPHARAVAELGRRGITVLVATSRRARVVRPCLERAGLALPAVLVDGAIGIDFRNGERFHEAVFDEGGAAAALEAFRRSGLDPCVYVDDPHFDVVVSRTPSTCAAHLASFGERARSEDLDLAVATRRVYAFSVLGLPAPQLGPLAHDLVANGAQVVLFPEPRFGGYRLTANSGGVSKWSGIEAFCERAGISAGEVLCVGDGDNDLVMLDRAAVAVVVRGASKRVLATADHVIGPPQDHGWVSLLDLVP